MGYVAPALCAVAHIPVLFEKKRKEGARDDICVVFVLYMHIFYMLLCWYDCSYL